ncbi:MAG: GAF domain-containing protein [Deltaproteobacteria bacterium]|nr:GAF domain-containing protein [Deltaproteobacteria bacterium]
MPAEENRLQEVIRLGLELAEVRDVDLLLEHVLDAARRFVAADAGSIYVKDGDLLHFRHAQNDTLSGRLEPGKKLIFTTFSVPINSRSISGYVAESGQPLNIADVDRLPEGVPYSFDRHYDELSRYRTRSMLTLPLKTNRGKIIGVLQLINAKDEAGGVVPFDDELMPFVRHLANNAAIAIGRAQLTRTTILRMISMAELRDPKETGAHVNRVGAYSVEIFEAWARKKGLPRHEIDSTRDALRMAAMLHDVGKVAISDLILKKPGRFTEEEFAIMKEHTLLGARLFLDSQSELDELARDVALNHHERWDGRGYPGHVEVETGKPLPGRAGEDGRARGKEKEEIPLLGRIVAVADVYDALCSRRVYKQAWGEDEVLKEMREQAGRQFDPEIIDVFFESLDVMRSISHRYPDQE